MQVPAAAVAGPHGRLQLGADICRGRTRRASARPVSAGAFRPCIDIHKGKVKQIVGSTLLDAAGAAGDLALITNFETEMSPAEYARMYKRDGLKGGHVIMLSADPESRDAAQAALRAYEGGLQARSPPIEQPPLRLIPPPAQVGGGVTPATAGALLDAGASHVIVTSYVFRDGRLDDARLAELVRAVGRAHLVLDLSCRKRASGGEYYVVTDRWQRFSELAVGAASLESLARSCDEFLVHGVDVEGKQLGIDDDLVHLLGAHAPLPVTYAGGARTLDDLERVREVGAGRVDVTVGSALDIFGGKLPYAGVVAWHRLQEQAAIAR